MRILIISGLLLLGASGYAQAHIEARQRQAILERNATLEPVAGAPEPALQSETSSIERRLSPALGKPPSASTVQDETAPQLHHPSTERQLKPALEKATKPE